jgi:hypothetical protein
MIVRILSLAALLTGISSAQALIVPFTEEFSGNASGWLTGTSQSPTWNSTGGADGGSYISAEATMTPTGFGAALFRGNATSDASGDAFVGNWLSAGVTLFSAFIRHNAEQPLDIFARLDAGSGRAASSVGFTVPTNQWFPISLPIVDSTTSFQSYGQPPTGFSIVFTNIQNVQFFASPSSPAGTFRFDLDKVSVVPEPGTLGLLGLAVALLVYAGARQRLRSAQNK